MKIEMSETHPFVSVLTPTYNRRKFIPAAIKCFESQTYPKHRMEWVVLDDGTDSVEDLFKPLMAKNPNVRYVRYDEKILIGKKRNMCQDLAKGTYLCWMDDDDYYPPERVSAAVHAFRARGVNAPLLAGSTECFLYFADIKKIYKFGPYGPNHATNGTMVVHKDYASTHKYNETITHAEEKEYLEDYKNPMIQLDPKKVILVMCHNQNTFDKVKLRHKAEQDKIMRAQIEANGQKVEVPEVCKETQLKLRDFIKDKELREFYGSL
jgi:glycosyltransferase involved in cell wall biosynthesis